MSETKFTPGPWAVSIDERGYVDQIFSQSVATYRPVTRRHSLICPALPEGEANARLIAAAPDLYEALSALLANDLEYIAINNLSGAENNQVLKQARAALSKARGE